MLPFLLACLFAYTVMLSCNTSLELNRPSIATYYSYLFGADISDVRLVLDQAKEASVIDGKLHAEWSDALFVYIFKDDTEVSMLSRWIYQKELFADYIRHT